MDILQLAEEYYYYTFALVFAIGLLQGAILARGIRRKFPKLKKYAKGVSIIILILFSINAAGNISKFAEPSKVEFTEFVIPETPEAAFLLLVDILGLNAGIIAVDDYFDQESPGVSEGLSQFFTESNNDQLAILISGGNKVFITTEDYYLNYRFLIKKFTNIETIKSYHDREWFGSSVLFIDDILRDNLPL